MQRHQSFPEPKHVVFVRKCHRFFVAKVKQSKLELMRQANYEFGARSPLISFKWHLLVPHPKFQNKRLFWCDQGFLWVKVKPGSTVRLHILLHSEAQTGGIRRKLRQVSLLSSQAFRSYWKLFFSSVVFSQFCWRFLPLQRLMMWLQKMAFVGAQLKPYDRRGTAAQQSGEFFFHCRVIRFPINHTDAFQTRKMIWIRSDRDWRRWSRNFTRPLAPQYFPTTNVSHYFLPV